MSGVGGMPLSWLICLKENTVQDVVPFTPNSLILVAIMKLRGDMEVRKQIKQTWEPRSQNQEQSPLSVPVILWSEEQRELIGNYITKATIKRYLNIQNSEQPGALKSQWVGRRERWKLNSPPGTQTPQSSLWLKNKGKKNLSEDDTKSHGKQWRMELLREQSRSLSKGPPSPVSWAGFHNCYSSVAAVFFSLPMAVFTHDLVGGGVYVHICGEGKLVFCKIRTPELKSYI